MRQYRMAKLNLHALMLKGTIFELLDELRDAPSDTPFDKAYRQGMARALDVLKEQAKVLEIEDTCGLENFDYREWIG